ncbi:hypothetical protein LUZ60_017355 [Juncus effusus]|nr:hypothetical protein LUZ60_017355 [Juncus effusus]
MLATKSVLITQIHRTTSKVLVLISITSLIITSVTPVTLLPKPYYILPIIMVPVLVTLGFYFYLGTQTNNEEETDETRVCFIEHVNALTRLSELNQGLASLSSSGLIGILFGSWTDALNHAHHPYAKASVICMFLSFICSLLLMLLCQVRVDGLTSKAKVNLIRTIKAFCVFLFVMIALAALAVSSYFLNGFIVAVLLPVLLAGIVCFCVEFCTPANDHDRRDYPEVKLKSIFTTASKVTTLSFGIIMGIFGAYLGSQETNMHLNISIFFSTCAFVSGIILMLLSYERPKKPASMGVLFSVLVCSGIIFLAFGGLSVFFLVLMRL